MKTYRGIGTSEGVAIGSCYLLDKLKAHFQRRRISASEIEHEAKRLEEAIVKASEYISQVKEMGSDKFSGSHGLIFDVYLMLLRDDMLISRSKSLIKDNLINAEYALHLAGKELISAFQGAEDEYLRERGNDVGHIVQKLIRFLTGEGYDILDKVTEGSIVISHDLSPSDTTHIVKKGVKGFSTDLGSKISHTSILARSLGIPAVVGLEDISKHVETGDTVIIDGFEGTIITSPDEETLEHYRRKEERYGAYIKTLENLRDKEVTTLDGEDVYLLSNIEINEEILLANLNNSAGVGLYRTEYIYLQHGDVDEQKQYEVLKEAIEMNEGKPITIRTFDLGGEKLSEAMPHPDEQNPVMGLRAVRYSLRFKEFFLKQLRAILRVSVHGDIKIMFPMISGLDEYDKVIEIYEEAKESLRKEGTPFAEDIRLGVMMELPSLAIISDLIAKRVDFMSVGTNDLIQYTLGIDRNNEYVAYLYRPAHPAILSLLKGIIASARKEGIECSVCGEIAGEPKYIPVLLGLGYRHLSMSPAHILKAKKLIRQLKVYDCEELVKELAGSETSVQAEEKVKEFIGSQGSGIYFS
jgi:phosphotransferase system enzyme I (PtsI)